MPQQAASKPDSSDEAEKEAEFIDEPKYDRADIYSDDEFHSDETEKGDGELPAAKPAKHVKFSKPSNFQKTAKSAQNGNRVQKHSQGGDSGRKFNKKQNKRPWTPRSKSFEMLEHEDEFDGVEKGDRPDRPGGGFKKQQKPAKFKKNQGTMTDAPINAQKHRQAMPKARTRTESRTTVIKNKHLNI